MHRLALLFVGLLTSWIAPVHALTAVPRSFDELVALADVVLIGTVAQVEGYRGEGSDRGMYSRVALTDLEVLKGSVSAPQYELRVSGGALPDYIQAFPGAPTLKAGNRYVLFIRGNQRDMFPFVGVGQGVFQVQWDAHRNASVVLDQEGHPVRAVRDGRVAAGLTRSLAGAMTLDVFRREIRARLSTP